MKELEKTKRISIAAVLTILVVLIALLSYKKPSHLYAINSKAALEKITDINYLISQNEIDQRNQVLVDIRNSYEFDKGHMEHAINIPVSDILTDESSDILESFKENNKAIVLYGTNPTETIAPFMVLTQLGYDNLKILTVENSYYQNNLITKNVAAENKAPDINGFIQESIKKTKEAMDKAKAVPKPKITVTPKQIIPVKKKKKMPVEGGC
jgi:rhodanese-related sulfurtransferase